MRELSIPIALKTALTSLLTRRLFYGAAIACAVGVGLGAWLEPPRAQFASAATTVTLPQEQPDPWSGDASAPAYRPDSQPVSDPGWTQTAAVSPPAGPDPVRLADADETQVAASGGASPAQPSQTNALAGQDGRSEAPGRSDSDDPLPPARQPDAPVAGTADDTRG